MRLIRLMKKVHSVETNAEKTSAVKPLPERLRVYFWDYPFEKLSWNADRDLIIRRLLKAGSWEAITWLRKQIGDGDLRKWLIAHECRGLSPRQIRFWELILLLPKRQADVWTQAARATPWNQR